MLSEQLTHETSSLETKTFPVSILLNNFDIKQNIGSIFRLADAMGSQHVYLTGRTATPPSRKITNTARSAEKYVAYSYVDNALDVVRDLKSQGVTIISLELTQNSTDLENLSLDKNEKVCLILGSEKEGVDVELLKASDHIVHIAMHGHKSSLNVSTAAAIALYKLNQFFNS